MLLSPLARAQETVEMVPEARSVEARSMAAIPTVQIPLPPFREAPRPTGLAEVIRAKFPLAVEFRDLGVGWRELNWMGERYFTKGDTIIVNDAEQLVAYKFDERGGEATTREFIAEATGARRAFAPDDRFALTLLGMAQITSSLSNGQTGLRSFNAARFRFAFEPPLDSASYRQNLSLIYLRKIGEAVNAYSSTYLNVLPPLETAFAARQALGPFAANDAIFLRPGTNDPFRANPLLSRKKRQHLRKLSRAVLFYEAEAAADGLRAVLLLNGTARRVDAKAWAKLKDASQIE